MTRMTTTIKKSGPFFRHDPVKTFGQNVEDLMSEFAREGESDVAIQLRAGEGDRYPISSGVRPSRTSQHVTGRVRSLGGRPWHRWAVISINNQGFTPAQGVALMAAASWVEGQTHAFRKTTGRIARAINRDLAKGLD